MKVKGLSIAIAAVLDRDIPVKRQHPKEFTAAVLEQDNPGSAC